VHDVTRALGVRHWPAGAVRARLTPCQTRRSRRPIVQEAAMKSMYDDLATALVSATLCVAAASMFVVVFANMA